MTVRRNRSVPIAHNGGSCFSDDNVDSSDALPDGVIRW